MEVCCMHPDWVSLHSANQAPSPPWRYDKFNHTDFITSFGLRMCLSQQKTSRLQLQKNQSGNSITNQN